jgi:hypothetical protein
LRLGEFGELLGRPEALDCRRQHGVRSGVAIGRAIELRIETAKRAVPKLRAFCDCAIAIAACRDCSAAATSAGSRFSRISADAVHFRFVPALGFGERAVKAPEPSIALAGARFGFGEGRFETGQEPNKTLVPLDSETAPHPGEFRLSGTVGPLCPSLKKSRQAGKGWEIVVRPDIGARLAVGRDCFAALPKKRA